VSLGDPNQNVPENP